jgi:hypothetical protein
MALVLAVVTRNRDCHHTGKYQEGRNDDGQQRRKDNQKNPGQDQYNTCEHKRNSCSSMFHEDDMGADGQQINPVVRRCAAETDHAHMTIIHPQLTPVPPRPQ